MIRSIFLVQMAMFTSGLFAQESAISKNHYISFNTQSIQLKDEFNYGLVFNGLILDVRYSFLKSSDKNILHYTADLGFGANYKKGLGLAWLFRPIDLFYGFNIKNGSAVSLVLGPYLETNYQWEIYPELQSGHMFWFASLETGPKVMLSIPTKGKVVNISISNSIAGWTSRPEPATETTYYSLQFTDFVRNAHSHLKLGSFNRFNHTDLEFELVIAQEKKLTVGYEFEYFGFYRAPKYSTTIHAINLKWRIGKKTIT